LVRQFQAYLNGSEDPLTPDTDPPITDPSITKAKTTLSTPVTLVQIRRIFDALKKVFEKTDVRCLLYAENKNHLFETSREGSVYKTTADFLPLQTSLAYFVDAGPGCLYHDQYGTSQDKSKPCYTIEVENSNLAKDEAA